MFHKRLMLALLVCLAGFAPGFAANLPMAEPAAAGFSPQGLQDLKAHFQAYVDEGRLVGLTTLVARHGKVVQFETYGQRDKATAQPMGKDALFRIYSMTKPVTGVAMMMLYEDGKFGLDDPVAKYLPEFKDARVYAGTKEDGTVETVPAARPITIRDLMRHTAGLSYGIFSDTPVDHMYREGGVLNFDQDLAGWVKTLAAQPLLVQPGERWIYSFAVDVQGRLVEVLSGQPLDRFLAGRLFDPLGMNDTGFAAEGDAGNRLVEMYVPDKENGLVPYRGDLYQDFTKMPRLLSGGGGLVSSTTDYWRFCQMLLNGGELDGVRILKPETVALMHRNQLPDSVPAIDEKTPGVGFGLDFAVVVDPAAAGNGARKGEFFWGGMANTIFFIDPEQELIAILMTNILPSGIYPFREELRDHVYEALAD